MDNAMRALGRFVRERREALGINQSDLGAAVGRDQKYISDLERGAIVNLPPLDTLQGIAEELRITMYDLLIAAGYIEGQSDDRARLLNETARQYELERHLESLRAGLDQALASVWTFLDQRGHVVLRVLPPDEDERP